jgi:hypothetical protein
MGNFPSVSEDEEHAVLMVSKMGQQLMSIVKSMTWIRTREHWLMERSR